MKLQQIKRQHIENGAQLAACAIDEQAHRGHKRRQRRQNSLRLRHSYSAWALGIKHQTNSVSTRFNSSQCIFYAGNSTDLATND
jgi:hypothetical protein